MISFECPGCGDPQAVDEADAGRRGRCRGCGTIFSIPGEPERIQGFSPFKKRVAPFDPDFEGSIVDSSTRFGRKVVVLSCLAFLVAGCLWALKFTRSANMTSNQPATLVEPAIPAQDADPKAAPEPLIDPHPFQSPTPYSR